MYFVLISAENTIRQMNVFRMDEIDHMYDDMQDRLFEIDKNR